MRVQPPILVPCFAKQISVVFHSAPSMDHDFDTSRAKFRILNFVSKSELTDSSFFLARFDVALRVVAFRSLRLFRVVFFHVCVACVFVWCVKPGMSVDV